MNKPKTGGTPIIEKLSLTKRVAVYKFYFIT
jgi:hypothetical protein